MLKTTLFIGTMLLVILTSNVTTGKIIPVPKNYPTIQNGIQAANHGDTVLVAPGNYLENINFLGKNIVVASHFILEHDSSLIEQTVIDGSNPTKPDTASCVFFISGEDTSAVLEGFTITGGSGTAWEDEHGHGIYLEGGGILIAYSSPTIKNNLIRENRLTRDVGNTRSTGGSGIRVGDGSPIIISNRILNNVGMYGAGIVLNFSTAVVKHNIIANNWVYRALSNKPTYGGGGIWVGNGGPNIIENNTLVSNWANGSGSPGAGRGGALLIHDCQAIVRNNIIWGNIQDKSGPIYIENAELFGGYNTVEGGFEGEGNLDTDPLFADENYNLSPNSPCIDAGDPTSPRDPDGTRADMGARYFDQAIGPYLHYQSHTLDDARMNGNGRADASETVQLAICVKNTGVDARNVTICLSSNDPLLEIKQGKAVLGAIKRNQIASNAASPFTFSVLPDVAAHQSVFYLAMTADGGYADLDSFKMIIGTSSILLIDDDQGDAGEIFYQKTLESLSAIPLEWNIERKGPPELAILQQAQSVIWFTGESREQTLAVEEQAVISRFLDDGGKLIISGNHIGHDLANNGSPTDSAFYAHYLHAQFVSDSVSARLIGGVSGDPITSGMMLGVQSPNAVTFDEITPLPPANLILMYRPQATGAALRYMDEATGTRLIYLGFGLENINGPRENSATIFLEKCLEWLTQMVSGTPSFKKSHHRKFTLVQNYPNPFNSTTTIRYALPQADWVTLKVFDVRGREIKQLLFEKQTPGQHSLQFDGTNLTSGIYFYQLKVGPFSETKRLLLLK